MIPFEVKIHAQMVARIFKHSFLTQNNQNLQIQEQTTLQWTAVEKSLIIFKDTRSVTAANFLQTVFIIKIVQ